MQINTNILFISPGSGKIYKQTITHIVDDESFCLTGTAAELVQTTFPLLPAPPPPPLPLSVIELEDSNSNFLVTEDELYLTLEG